MLHISGKMLMNYICFGERITPHIIWQSDRGTGICHGMLIRQRNVNSMTIFLSYGRDSNAALIEKIKDYLPKDVKKTSNMRLE